MSKKSVLRKSDLTVWSVVFAVLAVSLFVIGLCFDGTMGHNYSMNGRHQMASIFSIILSPLAMMSAWFLGFLGVLCGHNYTVTKLTSFFSAFIIWIVLIIFSAKHEMVAFH